MRGRGRAEDEERHPPETRFYLDHDIANRGLGCGVAMACLSGTIPVASALFFQTQRVSHGVIW